MHRSRWLRQRINEDAGAWLRHQHGWVHRKIGQASLYKAPTPSDFRDLVRMPVGEHGRAGQISIALAARGEDRATVFVLGHFTLTRRRREIAPFHPPLDGPREVGVFVDP